MNLFSAVLRAVGAGVSEFAESLFPAPTVDVGPQWLNEFEAAREVVAPGELRAECMCPTEECELLAEDICDEAEEDYPDYYTIPACPCTRSSAAVSAAADPSPADVQAAGDEGPEGASAIPPAAPSGHLTDAWYCHDCGVLNLVQALTDPGEVSAPSPGGQVLEDDLAAHIMGDFVSGQDVDPLTATLIDALSSRIARCLLADFTITHN